MKAVQVVSDMNEVWSNFDQPKTSYNTLFLRDILAKDMSFL